MPTETLIPMLNSRPVSLNLDEWEQLFHRQGLTLKSGRGTAGVEVIRRSDTTIVIMRTYDRQNKPVKSIACMAVDSDDPDGSVLINSFWRLVGVTGVVERAFASDLIASLPPISL